MNWLDLFDLFNAIDRVHGWVMGAVYGGGTHTFRIERDDHNTGADYEAMLRKRGVVVFGRRVTTKMLIFKVKGRQARWAEHILSRAGAPIVSRQVDKSNTGASERHAGALPPAWRDRPQEVRRWKRR
jgi:hypothetical protein